MARLLHPITGRGLAIVCDGYGTTGAYSAHGLAVAQPAGVFRRVLRNGPLDDPNLDAQAFDRGVRWAWVDAQDDPASRPANANGPKGKRVSLVELQVGYLRGPALASKLNVVSGEDATDAALNWEERGLSDADALATALAWWEFWAGTDPTIRAIVPAGRRLFRAISATKVVCVTPLTVVWERDAGTRYPPP